MVYWIYQSMDKEGVTMRSCPKCGSYLPEGKLFCPACGRLNAGVSKSARESTHSEKARTHARIREEQNIVKRETWKFTKTDHPYQGNTYEQHRSHDPRSKDYYKSKFEQAERALPEKNQRVICAASYFGFFFFLPLLLLPNSQYAKFHANQGLVLFVVNIVVSLFAEILEATFGAVFGVIAAIPPLLMVYGAYNALTGKMTPLPFVGQIKLIKEEDTRFGGRR